jgi:hypothetical protein
VLRYLISNIQWLPLVINCVLYADTCPLFKYYLVKSFVSRMMLTLHFWTARRRFCYNERELQAKCHHIRLPHQAPVALIGHLED